MTVSRTGPSSSLDPPPGDPSSRRWLYVALLLLVGLGGAGAVIVWPLYGTAAAVVVTMVIAIVHICRS